MRFCNVRPDIENVGFGEWVRAERSGSSKRPSFERPSFGRPSFRRLRFGRTLLMPVVFHSLNFAAGLGAGDQCARSAGKNPSSMSADKTRRSSSVQLSSASSDFESARATFVLSTLEYPPTGKAFLRQRFQVWRPIDFRGESLPWFGSRIGWRRASSKLELLCAVSK